jgi:hypothetical protein
MEAIAFIAAIVVVGGCTAKWKQTTQGTQKYVTGAAVYKRASTETMDGSLGSSCLFNERCAALDHERSMTEVGRPRLLDCAPSLS